MFFIKVGNHVNLRFYSSDHSSERARMSVQGEQCNPLCGSTIFGAHTFFSAPLQVVHFSYVLLLDGCMGRHCFGFISLCAFLLPFFSLLCMLHTKSHGI